MGHLGAFGARMGSGAGEGIIWPRRALHHQPASAGAIDDEVGGALEFDTAEWLIVGCDIVEREPSIDDGFFRRSSLTLDIALDNVVTNSVGCSGIGSRCNWGET